MLYAGVAVFVLLGWFTAESIAVAWRTRGNEASAEAVLDLVGERTAPRPTAAPGAMAWLRRQLDRYEAHIDDPARAATYRSLVAPAARVPDALSDVAAALSSAANPAAADVPVTLSAPLSDATGSFRRERLATVGDRTVVVTRRAAVDAAAGADSESNRLVKAMAPRLAGASAAIAAATNAHPLPSVPDTAPPRPVRVYAVAEDGTLASLPFERGPSTDAALAAEAAVLSGRPGLPAFAPEDFFFHFDPSAGAAPPAYSGFYLDLGGRGLVSTITSPVTLADGRRVVVAVDLAFDINWAALAAGVAPPVAGAAVDVPNASAATWTTLDAAAAAITSPPLRGAVRALAEEERQTAQRDEPAPLRHANVPTGGAVAAFQVSDRVWLLMFFPAAAPAFPFAAVTLLGVVLSLLLVGFEVNRRRAEDERQKAEGALAEKQNLLNTMQVPLVVVDPNTDVIVSANRAADAIGVRAGARFADLVWPDDRSREHYARMQVASPEPRRAYGLPVVVRDADGHETERYAVVRSVAVTAPIEALSADERHRLGILFVLDDADDLSIYARGVDARAHREERRRLAGLLSHGVDTLARVLEHCLSAPAAAPPLAFSSWLAEYLERRLNVTAWLLDHWDATPPLAPDHVVDAGQVRATIDRLGAVLDVVRGDRALRSRLHWDNGTLASAAPGRAAIDARIDWPAAFVFTSPVRGGAGMFLGEVIGNAVRHGRPGTVPVVDISCDPSRREIRFRVENETADTSDAPPSGDAYGGLSILRALARLFDWRDLTFTRAEGRFVVAWSVPASAQASGDDAD